MLKSKYVNRYIPGRAVALEEMANGEVTNCPGYWEEWPSSGKEHELLVTHSLFLSFTVWPGATSLTSLCPISLNCKGKLGQRYFQVGLRGKGQ
jgi:hypothetical protein